MVSNLAHLIGRARFWRRDESGATAIEFAIVAMPFLMLLFGIMSVSLFYFTSFSLENAAWHASRAIRTGQLQQSMGAYAGQITNEDRKKAFKKELCRSAPTFLDCESKAVVIVQSNAGFAGISEPSCATDGVLITESTAPFNAGEASSVVLITVCYPWAAGSKLPFFKMSNLANGALLLQTSVALRTEPYK
jgi:Flp pilus assembly protein TadG